MGQPSSPERKRATFYIVLIFACGLVTGALARNVWTNLMPRGTAKADTTPSIQHRVEKFTRELNLTPEQAKQLNQILDETRNAYREHEAKQDAIRQHGRNRIREILTEEQKPKYEQLLARMDARHKRQRK